MAKRREENSCSTVKIDSINYNDQCQITLTIENNVIWCLGCRRLTKAKLDKFSFLTSYIGHKSCILHICLYTIKLAECLYFKSVNSSHCYHPHDKEVYPGRIYPMRTIKAPFVLYHYLLIERMTGQKAISQLSAPAGCLIII